MTGCLGFHHIGTFLLLVSSALLIATSVTAPVVPDLALLKVTLTNITALRNSSVTFGALGHCVLDVAPASTDQDLCSARSIGYSIGQIVSATTGVTYQTSNLDALTRAFVLHPVAAGLVFIAFLVAAVSHRLGFIFSALVASLAWLVTLVVLVIDVIVFVAVKKHIEGDGSGATAAFGIAFWLVIAASVTLFLGYITTLFSCISDRMTNKY